MAQILYTEPYAALRFDFDVDGNLIYLGKHVELSPSSADETWIITKYTYDVNGTITMKQTTVGAWDSRASLPW